jgi:predicted nucleic acid-binding protein
VTDLIALSRRVQLHFNWRPNLSDEGDNKFVEAAIHAAAIIVTYNMKHFHQGELPQLGWWVMTPKELFTRYF